MNSRERILTRIHEALQTPIETPIAKPSMARNPFKPLADEPLEVCFAQQLQLNGGDFFFCQNLEAFLLLLKKWLAYKNVAYLSAEEPYLQALLQIVGIDYEIDEANWEQIEATVVLAEALVAETGSILISSKRASGRKWLTFPPIQVVVAFTSQLVDTLENTLNTYQQKNEQIFPSMLSLITAPSQTNTLDSTRVVGAQGAKELVVFLIDEMVEA